MITSMQAERLAPICRAHYGLALLMVVAACRPADAWSASPSSGKELEEKLSTLNSDVLGEGGSLRSMLRDDVQARLREVNRRSTSEWKAVKSREAWERLRDSRIADLKNSLGEFPEVPEKLNVWTTGTIDGDNYRIENLVFESRPGLLVTANLYTPSSPQPAMPGILICHSHHNPKTQGELQDMGMTWASQGCLVLVMDQLGHGERRQHPFQSRDDYPEPFRAGRQDYYFRYHVGQHLHLVGESLAGWMAWDLMRGVDLLLSRPGIDSNRIILLGAVAGGGDPAAIAGALDSRITCVVPFNFGGPQPETRYPLPEDAEETFHYAGSGSWESTRNLRRSAGDGFLPWVIVGAVAPRRLIYAHEFAWDQPRDPVWKRLQTIFEFYDRAEHLAFAHGFGRLQGRPPEASHCNNIGTAHREMIYPPLNRWFDMPIPDREVRQRRPADELQCLDGSHAEQPSLIPAHRLADRLAEERITRFRERLQMEPPDRQLNLMRETWHRLLGEIDPFPVEVESRDRDIVDSVRIERIVLRGERDIRIPLLLFVPQAEESSVPIVVAVSQGGKSEFLTHRAKWLASLLQSGIAVCLPDLRGCGESRPGDGRGRRSEATAVSASELMLGQTLIGARLRDVRSVLAYLRERGFERRKMALHGESFAPVNPPDRNVHIPADVEQPALGEPGGPLLALLGALYEAEIAAVSTQGGLISFRSVLESPFLHLPHDAIVPGAITAGEIADLAACLSPRPVLVAAPIDGRNRRVSEETLTATYASVHRRNDGATMTTEADPVSDERLADWVRRELTP